MIKERAANAEKHEADEIEEVYEMCLAKEAEHATQLLLDRLAQTFKTFNLMGEKKNKLVALKEKHGCPISKEREFWKNSVQFLQEKRSR